MARNLLIVFFLFVLVVNASAGPAPAFKTIITSAVGLQDVEISVTIDPNNQNTTLNIIYWRDDNPSILYESGLSAVSGRDIVTVKFYLVSLQSNVNYSYRVKGVYVGGIIYSADYHFQTLGVDKYQCSGGAGGGLTITLDASPHIYAFNQRVNVSVVYNTPLVFPADLDGLWINVYLQLFFPTSCCTGGSGYSAVKIGYSAYDVDRSNVQTPILGGPAQITLDGVIQGNFFNLSGYRTTVSLPAQFSYGTPPYLGATINVGTFWGYTSSDCYMTATDLYNSCDGVSGFSCDSRKCGGLHIPSSGIRFCIVTDTGNWKTGVKDCHLYHPFVLCGYLNKYGFQDKGAKVKYSQGGLSRAGRIGFGAGGFERVLQ